MQSRLFEREKTFKTAQKEAEVKSIVLAFLIAFGTMFIMYKAFDDAIIAIFIGGMVELGVWAIFAIGILNSKLRNEATTRKTKMRERLSEKGLSEEACKEAIENLERNAPEVIVALSINSINSKLEAALWSLMEGDFERAAEYFKETKKCLEKIKKNIIKLDEMAEEFGIRITDLTIYYRYELLEDNGGVLTETLSFAARACDALYLGDVEKMRELLNEAREMLDKRDKFVIGDVKFFKYLFEFHYFLLKAVVEAYEAEVSAVAKATQEQAERFAKTKPVEVPQTVEKVTVSAEEPERELYRDEVRFKMGAMSQERVGTLVITNKRLKLTGKYRLRGAVPTVALKAALRAAGVGEVYEDIPLKEVSFLELKKAILGGYYLEFKAKGKKYTIYTDAAQHIHNLLRQYTTA